MRGAIIGYICYLLSSSCIQHQPHTVMATRRRIGVSAATTEAARRQLMQPVSCWEKVWVVPSIPSGSSSTLKVYKWVKTEKIQVSITLPVCAGFSTHAPPAF